MDAPLTLLPGIGAKRAALYNAAGIETLGDLLGHFPRDYINLTNVLGIADCPTDEYVAVRGMLTKKTPAVRIRNKLNISKAVLEDATGSAGIAVFNMPHFLDRFEIGKDYIIYGKLKEFAGKKSFQNPRIFDPEEVSGYVPVYPAVNGILHDRIAANIKTALSLAEFSDPLDPEFLSEYDLLEEQDAYLLIHAPKCNDDIEKARDRLAFDELYNFRLRFYKAKFEQGERPGIVMRRKHKQMERFLRGLPFEMTDSQKSSVAVIIDDLCGGKSMHRMLCGDVGSGKTAVAAAACAFAFANNYQSAFMAPTEILARQHFKTLEALLSPLGIAVTCLTGALSSAEHKHLTAAIADGSVHVVVGTHALFSDSVTFHALALVITDEQHRFGVRQREKLAAKGDNPHRLIMSATPIPRTMAMMVYGDIDISYLTDMPKGRKIIETFAVTDELRDRAYGFIKKQLDGGRQGYIVCARIDDNDDEINAVESYAVTLSSDSGVFRDYNIGLLHGRLSPDETAEIMSDFIKGDIQLLVSTTVIEVGVDVPNATVILIEDADLFGLSQLHQLRGRVGRSEHQSYCILMTANPTPEVRERLKMLSATPNGYDIARYDLSRRGAGDLFGFRQSGFANFKFPDRITPELVINVDVAVSETLGRPLFEEEETAGQGELRY
jgi:ATP-dependent DNA helicase RecG